MRGRPTKSKIREKIAAIINLLGCSYGYEIYKYYKEIFNDATSRVLYYHLKKGIETGEFIALDIREVEGNYSWGNKSERIYYTLGPFAEISNEWIKKIKTYEIKKREINYDWTEEIKKKISQLREMQGKYNDKIINKKIDQLENFAKEKKAPEEIIEEIKKLREK